MKSEGKPKLSLVPKSAIWGAAEALTYGMQKHGKYSFKENGFPYTDLADKVLRHMTEWLDGNDFDKETGFHQLHHAIADLAILIDVVNNNSHQDDRFKRSQKKNPEKVEIYPKKPVRYGPTRKFHPQHDTSELHREIDKILKGLEGDDTNDNSK